MAKMRAIQVAINDVATLAEVTADGYDKVMALNARGPFFTVQALAPLIRDGGAVVLTTSVSDVQGRAGTSVYSASKAALRSMARTLAGELVGRSIRVNAVSPSPIDTGILEKSLGAEAAAKAREQFIERNPMHRFGEPEEVARAVAFLAFEATFTTGAELPVDGGTSQV